MRFTPLSWIFTFAALVAPIAHSQTSTPSKAAATFTKASEIPVETFFRRAAYAQMSMSPDGLRLAAIRPVNGRDNLVVLDFQAGKFQILSSFKEADVADFEWISNDRLYFRAADLGEGTSRILLKGAYAIDVDGSNLRDLTFPLERASSRNARQSTIHVAGLNLSFRILSRTFDGSGDVIAEINGRSKSYADVYRFNTKTGEYKLLTVETPGNVVRWLLDRDLVPRIAIRAEERTDPNLPRERTIWHRAVDGTAWEKVGVAAGGETAGSIEPIAFDFDNKTLYVSSNVGLDRRAIFKFDIAERKLGEKLLQHPLIDLNGGLVFSKKKKALLGVRYHADVPATTWFDPELARLQAAIDKALPDNANFLYAADEDSRYVLIYSASDTNPGGYFFYNTEKRTLQEISNSRSWLPPALMGKRKFITYKSRDGMDIPAWVTIPAGSDGKNLPLVVHIHGGPWVRAYGGVQWGRSPIAQFLASRGYAVLEPEPRGSTGFGKKHYASSFKQWGLAMQDDITDGALQLVKDGVVDKSRMCLLGASYGGYATLQGLVKDPDLWQCGVAYVAVTDLELLQTVSWSDMSRASDYLETDFKRYVGDSERDREQFRATSPA
ncbi:MAG: prolyl oligopeptidase family serine peptidase, partial [Usitatibacteraceae bacterium]